MATGCSRFQPWPAGGGLATAASCLATGCSGLATGAIPVTTTSAWLARARHTQRQPLLAHQDSAGQRKRLRLKWRSQSLADSQRQAAAHRAPVWPLLCASGSALRSCSRHRRAPQLRVVQERRGGSGVVPALAAPDECPLRRRPLRRPALAPHAHQPRHVRSFLVLQRRL